jgi:hypothetical protein
VSFVQLFNDWVHGSLTEGELSTVDRLEPTSLEELLLIVKLLFSFCYNTSFLNEEVNCTEPSPSISVPWYMNS